MKHCSRVKTMLLALLVGLPFEWVGTVHAQPLACPQMGTSDWGVLDYRKASRSQIDIVEGRHFTPRIEQLQHHEPGTDISYTLRRFQNHPRALMAMTNLALREKSGMPRGAEYPVECYLKRAEEWFPDDSNARMIYGTYLMRTGRVTEAVGKLESAREINPNDANLHYNLGLAYVQLKRYVDALESAHRAYALGFPLPGLRNQLQRAGRWRDPG